MSPAAEQSPILVVDDEEVIRQSFQDQLEDLGYPVFTAADGQLAVEQLQQTTPDLILTDLRMPKMTGLELIKHCKVHWPEIPIIVISGAGVIGDAVEALRLGAYDYLIKPIRGLDILEHTVDKALNNARLVRENRAYQEHLEELVEARTRELNQTNAHLEAINGRLRKIVETTKGFSSCADVISISTHILDEFADHMCASGGSLYFIEEEGLRRIHVLDEGHANAFIPFPLAENSIFKRVLESGKPLLIEEISTLANINSSGWDGYRDGSMLAFPLPRENGEIMGLLTLHTKETPPFVEEDKEIGAILASYSCEAIRSINATETLRQSERRFRELADMLPLTVCETNVEGTITYANREARQSYGYRDSELGELTIFDMVLPGEGEKITVNAGKLIKGQANDTRGTEYTARRKDGSTFPVLAYSAPILGKEGVIGIRTAAVDISLLKQQQEQILRHAHFDSLTGMPNRFLVLDRLAQLTKEAQRSRTLVAVLFLDLDDFKKINDTLGHETGDRLLVQAAERLSESLREGDTVGRLGGDEFVVLLGGLARADDARPVAANILERFRKVFLLDDRELLLTTSLGIAVYPIDGREPAKLLRNADSAMYYSKEQGRNTYHYYTDDMNRAASRRLLLEEQLHGALERQELYVHYQPFIDIGKRRIVGAEALLRWDSASLGPVFPDEFIPILEQNGQIISVGRHVLATALELAAEWHRIAPFKIAVNLSPRQFRDPGMFEFVQEQLEKNALPGSVLELEITEGVLMSANTFVDELLTDLSRLGVTISMDDFGTGYSSLSYLRNYPFNTLKIDRSFIQDITFDPADRELVSAAITMGRNLGLNVVAEGVETEEQLEILKQLGCELAQGYLFSRPVAAEAVPGLIAAFNAPPS
jgi:diguanylate cyclase (GGDEF)-like protein/PAS domain S-box-containing protein